MRIINGEIVPEVGGPPRKGSTSLPPTPVTLASLAAAQAQAVAQAQDMPSLALEEAAHASPSHAHSYALSAAGGNPRLTPSPPPSQPLHYNAYLSATAYGAAPLTSGGGFADDSTATTHSSHSAATQAYMQAYYSQPYNMHAALAGFAGTGFILGGRGTPWEPVGSGAAQHGSTEEQSSAGELPTVPESATAAAVSQLPSSASSTSSSSATTPAHSRPGSSCPSPLLTSTIARRKSKPHNLYIPPTHALTPAGVLLPVRPPPQPLPPAAQKSAQTSPFNLFGLPPVYIDDIRIAPHVYLLTGLLLYAMGPPALIPLVACFFFYRWHLQQRERASTRSRQLSAISGVNPLGAGKPPLHPAITVSHSHSPTAAAAADAAEPAAQPKAAAPMPQKKRSGNPNIHSLFD